MITWDVDDRPATLRARAYTLGMRVARDKQAFEGEEHTRQVARERQQSGNCPPTRLTRRLTRVRTTRHEGMTVWTVCPRGKRPIARVLYVHGGGYVHPLTADYWRLVRDLVRAGIEVVVPAYPLAPDATVDTVLPKLQRLAEDLLNDLPTVFMGDSAGGALVLVLAQRLRDDAKPQPAGVVVLVEGGWTPPSTRTTSRVSSRATRCSPNRDCVPLAAGGPVRAARPIRSSAP